MQDIETKSLWSQVSGECISGELLGKLLTLFPASHMTYAEFGKLYPNGVLLRKDEKGLQGSPYDDYFADREKLGMFGRANNYSRLDGKEIVFGLRLTNGNIAITRDYLIDNGHVIMSEKPYQVIVTYNSEGNAVSAFSLKGMSENQIRDLKFEKGLIAIANSEWDGGTGLGRSEGAADLMPIPVITAYWFAWVSFFPETELVK